MNTGYSQGYLKSQNWCKGWQSDTLLPIVHLCFSLMYRKQYTSHATYVTNPRTMSNTQMLSKRHVNLYPESFLQGTQSFQRKSVLACETFDSNKQKNPTPLTSKFVIVPSLRAPSVNADSGSCNIGWICLTQTSMLYQNVNFFSLFSVRASKNQVYVRGISLLQVL